MNSIKLCRCSKQKSTKICVEKKIFEIGSTAKKPKFLTKSNGTFGIHSKHHAERYAHVSIDLRNVVVRALHFREMAGSASGRVLTLDGPLMQHTQAGTSHPVPTNI